MDGPYKLYQIYIEMKRRCYDRSRSNYKYYGGKGIQICAEWKMSYSLFRTWALNNGYKEGLSIDRIDKDGNYCPENCRWITRSENSRRAALDQAEKRSQNSLYRKAKEAGLSYFIVKKRLDTGMSLEQALSLPRYARYER